MSRRQAYLIAYDIANPRRLQRVCRCVSRSGYRVQYSVFLAELTPRRLRALQAELRSLINHHLDDLRIYPLPKPLQATWLGVPTWPSGVQLIGGELPSLTLRSRSD